MVLEKMQVGHRIGAEKKKKIQIYHVKIYRFKKVAHYKIQINLKIKNFNRKC